MKDMRVMGSMIEMLSKSKGVTPTALCELLDCPEEQIYGLFKGLVYPSLAQLKALTQLFGVTIDALMDGDADYYNQNFVHCMGDFENPENREKILDIIEAYMRLKSEVYQ